MRTHHLGRAAYGGGAHRAGRGAQQGGWLGALL